MEAGFRERTRGKREEKRKKKTKKKDRKYVKEPVEVHTGFERKRYFIKSTDKVTI